MAYNFIEGGNYSLIDHIEDRFGFFDNYPLSQHDIINLNGGVPSREVEYLVLDVKSQSEFAIKVEIETNLYESCRVFNFKRGIINNNGLYVTTPGNWIGTTLFLNQVKNARNYGFERITVVAEGPDTNSSYTGHYKWGRVGFIMNQTDHDEFHIWIASQKRNEYTLGELLLIEEGCRRWLIGGFTWAGKFYLYDDTESMDYLKDYLIRIGCDFKL